MDTFLSFFENMPAWQRFVWIVICMSSGFLLELITPLFTFKYKRARHAGVNLVFLTTTLMINVLFGLATVGVFSWMEANRFGLLHWVDFPVWVELVISLLVFDLVAQYFVHVLLHKYKWMWKLHMVHHSDTHVDVTTGTRHHPIDFFLREMFALLAVLITGAPLAFYMFYRVITIPFTYFTHANIKLPYWFDKSLSYFFVTPNMHKFHHHFKRPWTNSNYGNILSIWDRMFGTFVYKNPRDIRFGLDVLEDTTDENIGFQFGIPFNKTIKTDY